MANKSHIKLKSYMHNISKKSLKVKKSKQNSIKQNNLNHYDKNNFGDIDIKSEVATLDTNGDNQTHSVYNNNSIGDFNQNNIVVSNTTNECQIPNNYGNNSGNYSYYGNTNIFFCHDCGQYYVDDSGSNNNYNNNTYNNSNSVSTYTNDMVYRGESFQPYNNYSQQSMYTYPFSLTVLFIYTINIISDICIYI